jgi:hypothetical protein
MGPLGKAVFLALVRLPVWHEDTEEIGREDRLAVMAASVENATLRATCGDRWAELVDPPCRPIWRRSPEELASLLSMKAWKETALAARWHAGDCRGKECDGGTSMSPWQLKRAAYMVEAPWEAIIGTDLTATTWGAWYAARALSCGYNRCRSVEGAVSVYATGGSCDWSGAPGRVRLAQAINLQIRVSLRDQSG